MGPGVFWIVQIYEGDLFPELGRLAAALMEPLEVLKRHWERVLL